MKPGLWIAISGMILSAATAGLAQSVEQGGLIENLQVKEISVAEIDSSHVKVTVNLSLIPQKTATLKDIQLCSLHLNGLPVFAAPLSQEPLLSAFGYGNHHG